MKKLLILLSCLLIISLGMNIYLARNNSNSRGIRTDSVTVIDTLKYSKPIPKDSTVLHYITKSLPVLKDCISVHDTDSVKVIIPVSQKRYGNDNYEAYISGYNASLDSIHIYNKVTTVTRTIKKDDPFSIGIGIGYGIGTKGMTPFIGVSLQYTLFKFGK